jgi:cell division protein FtsQ
MVRGVVRGALFRWGVGGVVGVALLTLVVTQAPRVLRRLEVFHVAQVEVAGTRYLAPHEALAVSGIDAGANLFDDPTPWLEALRAHPLVAEAEVEREFPNRLVLRIVEVAPVALVATPVLRPVDGRGRLLPIEPAAEDVDLPVIAVESGAGEDGRLADPAALVLVEALDRLGRLAPGLLAQISAVAPLAGGDLRLLLREPARGEALLPADFTALRIEQLRLTLADLEAKRELPRARRIDVRFRDQVVVSLTSS